MKCPDELSYYRSAALATAPVPSPADVERFAAWDSVDLTPLAVVPTDVMGGTWGSKIYNQAADIYREGVRGRTARSELAKDIEINRRALRHAQTFLTVHLDLLSRGRANERRVKLLDQVVERAHRRLIASYQLLANLEAAPAPTLRISADKAAFAIDARSTTT